MDLFCVSLLLATIASPVLSQTVCQNTLHGNCVNLLSGTSHCGSGNHLVLSYCGFLEACCYGAHHTSPTSAPTHAPSHTGGSGSHTPSNGQCGNPAVSGNHKIVGGSVATHGEYPWQVSLRYGGHHMCGGTLISDQWVVTAAHCFTDTSRSHWTVAVGIHDRGHIYSSQIHNAIRVITHEHYDHRRNHNDIALIKLDKPVDTTTTYVRTACLPESNENFVNDVCTVTGWGAMHEGGPGSRYLEEVDVPILTNSMCHYYLGNTVYTSNICAGYSQGGKDACQGDSGGPLTCKKNGVWKLAGIVSWGYGCAQRNAPGVYTRVSSFLDWIRTQQSRY